MEKGPERVSECDSPLVDGNLEGRGALEDDRSYQNPFVMLFNDTGNTKGGKTQSDVSQDMSH